MAKYTIIGIYVTNKRLGERGALRERDARELYDGGSLAEGVQRLCGYPVEEVA